MKKDLERKTGELVIYQSKEGKIELQGNFSEQTIWATQAQIAQLFSVTPQNVTVHLKNIFKDDELHEGSTCKESLQVQSEGGRQVSRKVKLYNLDVIIAVGYRVNSVLGTRFRIWATKTLKDHLLKGYTVNEKRLKGQTTAKLADLQKTIALITSVRDKHLSDAESEGLLTVIKQYTDTWTTLLAYDEGKLAIKRGKKKGTLGTMEAVYADIALLKQTLGKAGEATELFARERSEGSLAGIFGNISQSFGGQALYPSIEEKAAHLLYFVVKNHPFSDGNKRTGAFLFLRFLEENNHLTDKQGRVKITNAALTALTLLVAESDPKEKEVMVALISRLIS